MGTMMLLQSIPRNTHWLREAEGELLPSTAMLGFAFPLYYLHLPTGKKSEILMIFFQFFFSPHPPAETQGNEPGAQTRPVKLGVNIEERKDVARI